MSNHIEEAKKILADADSMDPREDWAQRYFNAVQAKALIAIAEQLRIANLIALKAAWEPVETHATKDFERIYTVKNQIADDIAEALGIGGGSDD